MKSKLATFILAIVIATVSSCSNDEPVAFDNSLLESISRGEITLEYTAYSLEHFIDYADGNGWQKFSFEGMVGDGAGSSVPGHIIFQNGMIIYEAGFSYYDDWSDNIYRILQAYKKATHNDIKVYIANPIEFNEYSREIDYDFCQGTISEFSSSVMTIEMRSRIGIPKDNPENSDNLYNWYNSLYVEKYSCKEIAPLNLDENLVCSGIRDAELKIIELCRSHFGNKIDMSKYYYFDNTIIDLDELLSNLNQ